MQKFKLSADSSLGAQELRDALVALLQASEELAFDASEVQRVSTTTLQVLLSAIRAAEQRGIPLRWQAVSPALREAAKHLGLTAGLQLPDAPTV